MGTKTHLRAVIAPLLLGNESEQRVARSLAREGFRLVYQSRASRGAFDLLGIIDSLQVGLQVKRAEKAGLRVTLQELERMMHERERLGWLPAIAIDTKDRGEVLYCSVAHLHQTRKTLVDEKDCERSLLHLIRDGLT